MGQKPDISFNEIIHDQRMTLFLVLIIAYALVYPVIAYVKVKRHLNGSFNDNREIIEKAFSTFEFIKSEESTDKIVYRKKSKFVRFIQWYEDSVVILPSENPVIISGMRKSVTRIDKMIDHLIAKKSQD
jgi:ABC-type maltose transport system permease subunit